MTVLASIANGGQAELLDASNKTLATTKLTDYALRFTNINVTDGASYVVRLTIDSGDGIACELKLDGRPIPNRFARTTIFGETDNDIAGSLANAMYATAILSTDSKVWHLYALQLIVDDYLKNSEATAVWTGVLDDFLVLATPP